MLLSLWWCQIIHIHYASINIATSVLGGRRWHGIWPIIWSPTRYRRSLWLWHCFMRRSGCLLTNLEQLMWINYWIIKLRSNRHHHRLKAISLLLSVLAIKEPVITSVATTNTLCMWHNECDMSMWWCCVHVIKLLMANKRWEPTFSLYNCNHVWVSVLGIKLITTFLSQYNPNQALKYDLSEKAINLWYIYITLKPKLIKI